MDGQAYVYSYVQAQADVEYDEFAGAITEFLPDARNNEGLRRRFCDYRVSGSSSRRRPTRRGLLSSSSSSSVSHLSMFISGALHPAAINMCIGSMLDRKWDIRSEQVILVMVLLF